MSILLYNEVKQACQFQQGMWINDRVMVKNHDCTPLLIEHPIWNAASGVIGQSDKNLLTLPASGADDLKLGSVKRMIRIAELWNRAKASSVCLFSWPSPRAPCRPSRAT